MNSWFCKTDRPFKFYGTMNDDLNLYMEWNAWRFVLNNIHIYASSTIDTNGCEEVLRKHT